MSGPIRGLRRWLPTTAFCACVGAVVAVVGFVPKGVSQPPDVKPAAAATGQTSAPPDGKAPVGRPSVPSAPGAVAPATPSPAPTTDTRIARAMNTRVCLQAGAAKVWTDVRRLGVKLDWPPAGEPQWSIDEHLFERGMRRLARRAERPLRNARMLHQAGSFRVMPGQQGQRLDRGEARRQLLAALGAPGFRRSLDAQPSSKPPQVLVVVPVRAVAPTVTPAHLGRINTLLASYATGLGGSSRNRRHNIRIACEAIDGTVLRPGDIFSYNDTVGPRSEQTGFRTAPVIIRGELVPGTGGGICQVSTTLYNAALLADLKIVRRSHHQFPVHYVPPGRDATVAYGSLDLRFANSLPDPVALDVKCVGSRVVVRVFGTPESKRTVHLINSRVGWTRPRATAAGGPARPGKRVTVSRVVQLADGRVRREIVSHDVYAPAPASARASRGSRHTRTRRRHLHTTGPGRSRKAPTAPNGSAVTQPSVEGTASHESPL